jgi:hypothetical protein
MRATFLSRTYFLSSLLITFGVAAATHTTASSQGCILIQAALPGKVFYSGPYPALPQGIVGSIDGYNHQGVVTERGRSMRLTVTGMDEGWDSWVGGIIWADR